MKGLDRTEKTWIDLWMGWDDRTHLTQVSLESKHYEQDGDMHETEGWRMVG